MTRKGLNQGKRLPLALLLLIWALFLCPDLSGQNEQEEAFIDETKLLEIESRMLYFYDQIEEIAQKVDLFAPEDLAKVSQQVSAIDSKWDVYYQSRQAEIANDDSLLQIVANYQLAKQGLLDSIAYKTRYFDAQARFGQAESLIASQDSTYKQLYETALGYSLLKQLAPQLETLKGKEQLLFADIQQQYETAKGLAGEFGELRPRLEKIEENYITLKNSSEKIQALEYKPLFQKIKDYLYGLAAVAMILMFLNMAQAKIKMIKQARENARKMSEMMNKDENDYPTI